MLTLMLLLLTTAAKARLICTTFVKGSFPLNDFFNDLAFKAAP